MSCKISHIMYFKNYLKNLYFFLHPAGVRSATRILSLQPFISLTIFPSTQRAYYDFLNNSHPFLFWPTPSPTFLYSYFIHLLDYNIISFLNMSKPSQFILSHFSGYLHLNFLYIHF